jgi:Zn finger protein HypA/HybF involved in hydrogenase expression
MGVKLTTEEVIRRVKNTHGDSYDLSKFVYTTQRTKSIFICKLHGEFLSQPKEVWGGTGCPGCGIEKFKPLSKWEDVKQRILMKHGDDYEFVVESYNGVAKKMKVVCKIHQHQWSTRPMDLIKGEGCPKCRYVKSGRKLVLKVPEFIERSRKTHGDKYDYSKVHQFKQQKKEQVKIICPTHGEFQQKPYDHYSGSGCQKCSKEWSSLIQTTPWEEVLKSFRETHGEQYEYNGDDYVNSSSKLRITCSKHGEFLQDVTSHKHGQGCPKCGRERISDFLTTPWEEVLKSFRETHNDKYEYLSETYSLLETPMDMFCKKHGMVVWSCVKLCRLFCLKNVQFCKLA